MSNCNFFPFQFDHKCTGSSQAVKENPAELREQDQAGLGRKKAMLFLFVLITERSRARGSPQEELAASWPEVQDLRF